LRTAYLSLTRGEGGQNLIGSEQGDLMGVVRTQELLAARKIDGAEQFFTRAIDFGFSKTADETLAKWGREQVLGDVVWTIRRYQPDVIVLRFSGTPRDGHGHHQSSAILGKEAFSAAADPTRFPEQLQWVKPWQAKRLLWNVFAFSREQEQATQQMANRIEIDTGIYDPVLGFSYGEIAGMSRSQHRSQGMGAPERRGAMKNVLVHVAGEPARQTLFDGIDITWSRVPNGGPIGEKVKKAVQSFQPDRPATTIPLLIEARKLMVEQKGNPVVAAKLAQVDEAIGLCAGIWLDASMDRAAVVPGSQARIQVTVLNRSEAPVRLLSARVAGGDFHGAGPVPSELKDNVPLNHVFEGSVPSGHPYSEPYWLASPKNGMLYTVPSQELLGLPEAPPEFSVRFELDIAGQPIALTRPVAHRYVDRVLGELTRPVAVVPPVSIRLSDTAQMFPTPSKRTIEVELRAMAANRAGTVRMEVPEGWQAEPASQPFSLANEGEQVTAAFAITPPSGSSRGMIRTAVKTGDTTVTDRMLAVNYPHIPPETVFPPAAASVIRVGVRTLAKRVGYVMGAGDDVPDSLRQLGCEIALLSGEDLARGDLSRFDAIVTGVRAYNVRPDLRANQQRLLEYVKKGGTMIVQYNVFEGGFMGGDPSLLDRIGPYPIKIGRERVTVEESPVQLPQPNHPVLQIPNEITSEDFKGWIQERGLYFASQWDERYQPLLITSDPGEKPLSGGLLYTKYGDGVYIFTAYAWFRQLPAGVPGAYRIFANMLSAGKANAHPAGGQQEAGKQ
jgi:hypothetical protein